jgi:hypothetical protein
MSKFVRSVALGLALTAGFAASPTRLLACTMQSGDTTGTDSFAGMFSTCDDAADDGKDYLDAKGDLYKGYKVIMRDATHWELRLYPK